MRAYGEDWLGTADLTSVGAECVDPDALAVA
jgi:hypothetical protein